MDKSMIGDLDNLPEEDKIRMSTMIEQLQVRDRSFFNSLFDASIYFFLFKENINVSILSLINSRIVKSRKFVNFFPFQIAQWKDDVALEWGKSKYEIVYHYFLF